MDVNYELYKYFYYVAKQGSVSKAAEYLKITQSALSQAIKQLELILETKLFHRTSKGMDLTNEGELLFKNIKSGIRYFQDGENKLKEFDKNKTEKTITIATTPILAKMIFFPKINDIKKEFPNVKFVIKSFNGFDDRVSAVRECLADIAIVKETKLFFTKEFELKKIMQLNYSFFYNPQFYSIDDEISTEQLNNYPLILKKIGTQTKNNLLKCFCINAKTFVECEHDEMIIDLVRSGHGVGFAPKEYLDETFKIINIKDKNSFSFNVLAIYRKEEKDLKRLVNLML